jgi:hypothetical protein
VVVVPVGRVVLVDPDPADPAVRVVLVVLVRVVPVLVRVVPVLADPVPVVRVVPGTPAALEGMPEPAGR